MSSSSTERHDHSRHEHLGAGHEPSHRNAAPGTHVMPDGTLMQGDPCDHAHGHSAQAATKRAIRGDQSQVEYTYPMHPQVRQIKPNHCPICGITLEAMLTTAETGQSPELRDMTRRL